MTVGTRQLDSDDYSTVRNVLATLGAFLTTVTLSVVIGPLGVLVAVGIGSAQYLVSTTAAFATGQIVLAALYPPSGSPVVLALAEGGLLCVLFSSVIDHHDTGRLLATTLVAGGAIGGSGWLALRSSVTIWIGAGVIVAGTALVAYGLHRYERVQLGLVEVP